MDIERKITIRITKQELLQILSDAIEKKYRYENWHRTSDEALDFVEGSSGNYIVAWGTPKPEPEPEPEPEKEPEAKVPPPPFNLSEEIKRVAIDSARIAAAAAPGQMVVPKTESDAF